jgi:S-adenosylmethionine synthetase
LSKQYLYSSEAVTQGHPDKMADQISDAILDAVLKEDKKAKVDCQTILSNGMCMVAGEMTTEAYISLSDVIRGVIRSIGYTDASYGFDYRTVGVLNSITEQSIDITNAVNKKDGKISAGDQAVVHGFAVKDGKNYLPKINNLAWKISHKLTQCRKDGTLPFLRPDGKILINGIYEDNNLVSIDNIIISSQHSIDVPQDIIKESIIDEVIKKSVPQDLLSNTQFIINPSGHFVVGGPQANIGISGRKTIVDTYGSFCPYGGGVISGQDATKIHRSGLYLARYIAKNMVAANICEKLQVSFSYSISNPEPISIDVNSFGTSKIEDSKIIEIIKKVFPLDLNCVIKHLQLDKPVFQKSAIYGHFGNLDNDFSWEKIDKKEEIEQYIK